ncbi:His/Glu/Gln/Arg/opine family amino acid ABC transporter permease subunit [Bradyrhizobium sp. USDA 327]
MTNWVWPVTLYLGKSLLVTLWISLLTVILATILGLLIAALSQSTLTFARFVGRLYVELFRGVPSLMILLFVFFALPQIGLRTGPLTAAIIGLGLWGGANIGEVFRGALDSIPHRQEQGRPSAWLERNGSACVRHFATSISACVAALRRAAHRSRPGECTDVRCWGVGSLGIGASNDRKTSVCRNRRLTRHRDLSGRAEHILCDLLRVERAGQYNRTLSSSLKTIPSRSKPSRERQLRRLSEPARLHRALCAETCSRVCT